LIGFSPRVKLKCDLLWFISDFERTRHLQRRPEDSLKAVFMPPDPGVKTMSRTREAAGSALHWEPEHSPQSASLEWYVEHIHHASPRSRGIRLSRGRTDEATRPRLHKALQQYSNISLCADPEN